MDFIVGILKSEYFIRITAALLIIFAGMYAARLIPVIEKKYLRKWAEKTKTDIDDRLIELITPGVRRLINLGGIFFASRAIAPLLYVKIVAVINSLCYIFLLLILANVAAKILQALLEWYSTTWSNRTSGRVSEDFGPLFKRIIVIVVYTIAIVMILHYFKQNVSSIIVSLGVGSLAVALAAKDTLANMIAGFMIMTDRPFRLGDRIKLETGQVGDVYEIGLRSTRIKTFDNTLIVVPNHQIVNEKVTNLSYPDPQIRVVINVGVAYGSDLSQVKKLLVDVCLAHPHVLATPPPAAFFVNFGDSSLDFKVTCRVPEWGLQWQTAEDIRTEINNIFEKEGIEIPFPQSVITVQNPQKNE